MVKKEDRLMAKDLPRYQKLWETEASQDILWWLTLWNPLKEWDKKWTIDNIMKKMELMVLQDDYKRSQNRNYKTSKEDDDEFNSYKKELKKLWVSFDDFRKWYYNQHPTPEMEAWQKAWDAMNNMFYNVLWPSPSQEKKEDISKKQGKKFIPKNNKND